MALWQTRSRTLCECLGWRLQHQFCALSSFHQVLEGMLTESKMMYTRASASDYDDFQAEGWKTKELLPLMKKHETYQRACNDRDIHGFEGPIKVSFGNYTYPIAWDFLRASESQGIPTTDDLQDLVTGHGAEHWLKWINRDTGRRSDSAHAYIHSNMRQAYELTNSWSILTKQSSETMVTFTSNAIPKSTKSS